MLSFKSYLNETTEFKYVELDSFMEYVEEYVLPEYLLNEGLGRKVKSSTAQPWKSDGTDAGAVKKMYDKYLGTIEKAKEKFKKKMVSATKGVSNPKYLVDIKSLESMVDKIVNRNKKPGDITDWLRGAILVKSEEDVAKVSKGIFKAYDRVEEYEEKNRGGDKNYGYYGSKHFLVTVDGITSEIQVMTKKLWAYKGSAHDIYDKYRSAKDVDVGEMQKAMRLSKQVFDRGNARGGARLDVDGGANKKLVKQNKSKDENAYKSWWKKNLKKVKK